MHLHYRNVNDAFQGLVSGFHTGTIPTHVQASRYGEVMSIEEPVILTYERPRERVLFNAARDVNPFFHVYEALWMLAGRNDVAPLAYYNSRMKEFSDDGYTLNGSYGYRWRKAPFCSRTTPADQEYPAFKYAEGVDQLQILIQHLKANPLSRRAVLSMWNVEDDLLKIDSSGFCNHCCAEGTTRPGPLSTKCGVCEGTGKSRLPSKDVACNLSVKFKVRQGMCSACEGVGNVPYDDFQGTRGFQPCSKCGGKPHDQPRYLDITVFNRSNDLVWGALGANYVHFGFLQEYMASHLGLEVGVYNQISDDLHAYTAEDRWKPEEWLAYYNPMEVNYGYGEPDNSLKLFPVVQDPATFDKELPKFVEWHSKDAFKMPEPYNQELKRYEHGWHEPFLREVAEPMMVAFHIWKKKEHKWQDRCLAQADMIRADDWRIACHAWLERRIARREAKV